MERVRASHHAGSTSRTRARGAERAAFVRVTSPRQTGGPSLPKGRSSWKGGRFALLLEQACSVPDAELESISPTAVDRPNHDRGPVAIAEVIAPAKPFVESGCLGIVESARHGFAGLDESAKSADDVLVAAVQTH